MHQYIQIKRRSRTPRRPVPDGFQSSHIHDNGTWLPPSGVIIPLCGVWLIDRDDLQEVEFDVGGLNMQRTTRLSESEQQAAGSILVIGIILNDSGL